MSHNEEEGTVASTVRGNGIAWPIEIVERDDGGLMLRQEVDELSSEQITVDKSQLRKLWYVLGMHVDLMDLGRD